MSIAKKIKDVVKVSLKAEGCKNIHVIKEVGSLDNKTYVLSRWEHHGKELSSISIYDSDTNCADILESTFRRYEDRLVDSIQQEIAFYTEDDEGQIEESSHTVEYEIQSDLESEDYYGSAINDYDSMMDNTDFDRWIDEHRGEIFEH